MYVEGYYPLRGPAFSVYIDCGLPSLTAFGTLPFVPHVVSHSIFSSVYSNGYGYGDHQECECFLYLMMASNADCLLPRYTWSARHWRSLTIFSTP